MSRTPGSRHARLTWLPAVVPADAERFHVRDAELARLLEAAGAVISDEDADVEISSGRGVAGDAPVLAVHVGRPDRDAATRGAQVVGRLRGAAHARAAAAVARAVVARLGYDEVRTLWWDLEQPLASLATGGPRRPARLVERLPRYAVVAGHRAPVEATLLDAVEAAAAAAAGGGLGAGRASAREGLVTAVHARGVLRVAVGEARGSLDDQAAALAALSGSAMPAEWRGLVPRLLGRARAGLADWSLEQRMDGVTPAVLGPALLEQSVEFLAALPRLPAPGDGVRRDAAVLAGFVPGEQARALEALAERVADASEDLPGVLEHGDFFAGNLLAQDDKLSGVIDWDVARPAGLPFVDLVHLQYTQAHAPSAAAWGPWIRERLLPWARGPADPVVKAYARRIGVEASPRRIESAVLAYWLGRAAFQAGAYADRSRRPAWLQRNVTGVLEGLRSPGG